MLRMYDYECLNAKCGEVSEELVRYEDADKVICPICGSPTKRWIGAPMFDPRLGLDAASFPTMGDKWAKIRRQRKKIESARDE